MSVSDQAYSTKINSSFAYNPYVTDGLARHYHLGESTFILRGITSNFILYHFMEIIKANKIAPDGTLCSVASHLGLYLCPTHGLNELMELLRDTDYSLPPFYENKESESEVKLRF